MYGEEKHIIEPNEVPLYTITMHKPKILRTVNYSWKI